jgi:hypothetical protein
MSRVEQRLVELVERIEALGAQLLTQLESPAWTTPGVALLAESTDGIVELSTDEPEE